MQMGDKTPLWAYHAGIRHGPLLLAVSISVLAYEILLMRLQSYSFWHHFASMIISMALLGFGAAGSFLFLFFHHIKKNIDGWLIILAALAALFFTLSYTLAQKVGLDPLNLVWQKTEWIKMLLAYIIMAIPFFLAGGIIGIILTLAQERTHVMYGLNLLGSGLGAAVVIPALYLCPPWNLIPALGGLVLLGCMPLSVGGFLKKGVGLLIAAFIMVLVHIIWPPIPQPHHTKPLPVTLNYPDAQIEARLDGPLGIIHVVDSKLIRYFPGLSLAFGTNSRRGRQLLPSQKALFVDGSGMNPVTRVQGDLHELEYLDFATMALPYFIRPANDVLIVGAGGGSDLLLALRHQTPRILVLEPNRQIVHLMKNQLGPYSGHIYSRPEVTVRVSEGRQFLHDTEAKFGLVHLSLLGSPSSASGGSHGVLESYLYTTEAFVQILSCLKKDGMMAISHWLQFPPRASLRILATAIEAMNLAGFTTEPARHLSIIRSWMTGTILLSKTPFKREEIEKIKIFCKERQFDVAFYAGMEIGEANRYDILENPFFYVGANAIAGPDRDDFIKNYLFDISPTTDNRPYFSQFFRLSRFATLFNELKKDAIPFVELGILFIVGTLMQATISSIVLILFPLLFLRLTSRYISKSKVMETPPIDCIVLVAYFTAIGLAFMFIEMVFLPQCALLLSHPIYSVAAVLSVILIAAGLGSFSLARTKMTGWYITVIPAVVVFIWSAIFLLAGTKLFSIALGWSFIERFSLAFALLFVISFFLGWPFPLGLRFTSIHYPSLVPWVWGLNGCASVIGALLGKYLSMVFGHQALLFLATGLYLFATLLFQYRFAKKWKGCI
jgi:hypothetical protein